MVDVVVDCFFEVDVQLKHFMEGVLTPYKNMQKKSKQSNIISFFTKIFCLMVCLSLYFFHSRHPRSNRNTDSIPINIHKNVFLFICTFFHLSCVFDSPNSTFSHEVLTSYNPFTQFVGFFRDIHPVNGKGLL